MPLQHLLYLEDLSAGMTFTAGPEKISEADIIAFATEFDPQPFHTDPEAAKSTVFKGLAASGWHTMALTMRMIVNGVPLAGGIIGFGGEISWPAATRPATSFPSSARLSRSPPRVRNLPRG